MSVFDNSKLNTFNEKPIKNEVLELNGEHKEENSEEAIGGHLKKLEIKEDVENIAKYEIDTNEQILQIRRDVEEIQGQIIVMELKDLRKNYKKFEEALILKTIILDNINTKGIESIKEERKKTILFVQNCMAYLDARFQQ